MTFRPAPTAGAVADAPAEVTVSQPVLIAKSFRRLERFTVDLRLDDGSISHHDRDVLRVGRIVAALPVDPMRGEVVLIRQFRLAAHIATGNGILVEIVAGHVEAGEQPQTSIAREIQEEIGVEPRALHELFSFLPAPGINDEYATMYLAIVDADSVPERAGAEHESEDTRPVRIKIADAIAALESGGVHNGYLILALQWLALHRDKIEFLPAMSAILLAISGWDVAPWERRFRAAAPGRDIAAWPDRIGDPNAITYVCAWKPPHGVLAGLPHLKAIFSLGAGVDFLMTDPALPTVPVVRVVDSDLTMRMTEYVVLHVLMHHRRQRLYDAQQRQHIWHEHDQPPARDVAVGIMGLGVLGCDAAGALRRLGFQVAGWSRTPKQLDGIETFHGTARLDAFLARTEILVCLLPHTPATEGILNLALFRKLKCDGALRAAYLINAGRGLLQIDADILAALDEGLLAGATLDVFPTEPLPGDSALWSHPQVTVTPHYAAASVPEAMVSYIMRQITRCDSGLPLENLIDRASGY